MGGFCCCPCGEEFEEYSYQSSSIYRHCVCLRYFLHQLFNGHSVMFHRLDGRSVASPIQGATSLGTTELGTALPDSSLADAYLSVPRPVSYDAEQRFSRLQRAGLVSRREKSMGNFQEDSQLLKRSGSGSSVEPSTAGKIGNEADRAEDCKTGHSESEKSSATKVFHGLAFVLPSEDEDVCPTCLDEYTPENPKIITRCSHHFHLGCIYEWMERSETCPLCGKEMEFCGSP